MKKLDERTAALVLEHPRVAGPMLSDGTLAALENLPSTFDSCVLHIEERDRQVLLLNHPDLIRSLLVSNSRRFEKGPEFTRIKMLTGAGMIVTDGAKWRSSRRVVQPAFVGENQHIFENAVDMEADELLKRWNILAADGAVIDIVIEAEQFALNVMMRAIFSVDTDQFSTETGGWLFDVLKSGTANGLLVAAKVRVARAKIVDLIVRRREHRQAAHDILTLLIQSRDALCPDMSDSDLADEVLTLIVAGFETSAILLGWFWYFWAKSPECSEFLKSAQGDLERRIQSMANECLRVYPPVWMFSRRALEDVDFGEVQVCKGDVVAVSPYFLHRRPDFWTNPAKFDPERFMNFGRRDPRAQAFVPFSAGPRRCIGDVFSEYEVQALMARLIPVCNLALLTDQQIELEPLINLSSRNPINVRLTPDKRC